MILAPLLKLPKNVGDLGKFIVAKGFKKLPKLQKIVNSGHTGQSTLTISLGELIVTKGFKKLPKVHLHRVHMLCM